MKLPDTLRRSRLALIVLAALVMRAPAFGDPVVHVDEEFYFVTAHAMTHAALPYLDVWDRKPIGLFLLYLPTASLGLPWGIYTYQALAFASVVAAAWLVARLADRAGWRAGATGAAIGYVVWLDLLGGVGGQAPVFFNLAMVAGGSLIVAGESHRRLRGIAAMALVGIALQIKYSVVFEGLFFGTWLITDEWRAMRSATRLIGHGALLVLVALLPTMAAFAYYAGIGHADAWIFANINSIFARGSDPWGERIGNGATLVLLLSPVVAMAAGGRAQAIGGDRMMRAFLFAWLAVALASVTLFGSWFDHYGLPVLVPGMACAAAFMGAPRWRRAGTAVVALAAMISLAKIIVDVANRGNARQFAALARAVGTGPGCLYVYSGTTMLYPASGRCVTSRYLFPSHLGREREHGAIGVDQEAEVRRLLAAEPAVIVMRPPYRGERPTIRAIVAGEVARHYRLTATLPMGRERIAVYHR